MIGQVNTTARPNRVAALVVMLCLSGCRPAYRRVLKTEKQPSGTCAEVTLGKGEKCKASANDFAAGASVIAPHGSADHLGAQAWYRWELLDAQLDARSLSRIGDPKSYRSLAGGVDVHLSPLMFWPDAFRYVDINAVAGADLGIIKFNRRVKGRFDGFLGASIEVFAPDFGLYRYRENGVPGIRAGVRWTSYVEGWSSETTFHLGLVWRWGTPIDLLTHWTTEYVNHD